MAAGVCHRIAGRSDPGLADPVQSSYPTLAQLLEGNRPAGNRARPPRRFPPSEPGYQLSGPLRKLPHEPAPNRRFVAANRLQAARARGQLRNVPRSVGRPCRGRSGSGRGKPGVRAVAGSLPGDVSGSVSGRLRSLPHAVESVRHRPAGRGEPYGKRRGLLRAVQGQADPGVFPEGLSPRRPLPRDHFHRRVIRSLGLLPARRSDLRPLPRPPPRRSRREPQLAQVPRSPGSDVPPVPYRRRGERAAHAARRRVGGEPLRVVPHAEDHACADVRCGDPSHRRHPGCRGDRAVRARGQPQCLPALPRGPRCDLVGAQLARLAGMGWIAKGGPWRNGPLRRRSGRAAPPEAGAARFRRGISTRTGTPWVGCLPRGRPPSRSSDCRASCSGRPGSGC